MSIRVLHVIPWLDVGGMIGGAARLVVDIVNALKKDPACDPRLCVMREEDPRYASYGLTDRPFFLGHDGRYPSLRQAAKSVRALKKVIREQSPAIVHSYLWQADHIAAAAVRGSGIPHVVSFLDTRPWLAARRPKAALRRVLYRTLLRASGARFIACADAVKTFACEHLRLAPSSVAVIRNGIDASWLDDDPAAPPASDVPTFGTAALLQPGKGHEVLLKACAELEKQRIPFRARIAGGGSLESHYRRLAQDMGIGARVDIAGCVDDMKAFYRSLDIFVLPSFSEGLPLTILEAMAKKKPVVATNVAGIPEAVRDGVDGLLVPPGDPAALAAALARLLQDASLRRSMGEKGHARVRADFTIDRLGANLMEYYRGLLSAPS